MEKLLAIGIVISLVFILSSCHKFDRNRCVSPNMCDVNINV